MEKVSTPLAPRFTKILCAIMSCCMLVATFSLIGKSDIKMDVRDMSDFRAGSFDAVVDKGTLDSILCGSNSRQNAAKMLEEVGRVLKDKGVFILITYGSPVYRLALLKESCSWTIKLHVIEKLALEGSSEDRKWELTKPIPLDDEGSSVETVLGNNTDVHYIYVCTKDDSLRAV